MIIGLLIILVIIIFLAFFVGKNLVNVCSLWFFKTYTDVSITVIIFIAFAAGIIFSLLCYFISRMVKASHENDIADAQSAIEKELKKREKINKKIQKKEKSSKSPVESSKETSDKEVEIEDRVHE